MKLELVKIIPLKLKSAVTAIAVTENENFLAVAQESENDNNLNVNIISKDNFKVIHSFKSTPYTHIRSILFINNDTQLVYHTETEIIIQSLLESSLKVITDTIDVRKMIFDESSQSIIVSGDSITEVSINNIENKKTLISNSDYEVDDIYPTPPLIERVMDRYVIVGKLNNNPFDDINKILPLEKPPQYAIQLDYDKYNNKIIALDYPNNKLHIWNSDGEKINLEALSNSIRTFTSFCIIPGTNMLVTGNKLGIITVYNLNTGEIITENQFQKRHIRSLKATKDGHIFSGSDDHSLICITLK